MYVVNCYYAMQDDFTFVENHETYEEARKEYVRLRKAGYDFAYVSKVR